MSRPAATLVAEQQAQQDYDAAAAERRRHDPQALRAREEIAEARLLEATEAHIEEQQRTRHDLDAAYRANLEAMDELIETLTSFVEAREHLSDTEATLTPLLARARKLGVEIPPYDSLAFRATRNADLNALQHRARRAVRDGFFGSR